jgi:hypothetical protein
VQRGGVVIVTASSDTGTTTAAAPITSICSAPFATLHAVLDIDSNESTESTESTGCTCGNYTVAVGVFPTDIDDVGYFSLSDSRDLANFLVSCIGSH